MYTDYYDDIKHRSDSIFREGMHFDKIRQKKQDSLQNIDEKYECIIRDSNTRNSRTTGLL
jgi:hypothetical protein